MTIIYDDISALEFYRAFEVRPQGCLSAWQCRSVLKAAGRTCNPSDLDRTIHEWYGVTGVSGRIYVLVPGRSSTRKSETYSYRTWDPPLERGALVEVGEDVYVVSAEMLFLRLAQRLDWLSLALVGLELCGRYRVGETRELRRFPLTTPDSLRRAVERHAGKDGVGKAKRALKYIIANSYSPMESRTFLLLCLPRSVGGYGLPFPEFNVRIDVAPDLAGGCVPSYYEADLFWRNHKGNRLDVEYNSDEHHSGDASVLGDSRRAATLSAMGIAVIGLRKEDVFYADAFDAAAGKIAHALQIRQRPLSQGMKESRIALRKRLLFSEGFI